MAINVPGLLSVVIFYFLILVVGIWAGWKNRGKGSQGGTEQIMLAGRDMGTFVGVLTMTGRSNVALKWIDLFYSFSYYNYCFLLATWVGGGYVIGSTEGAFTSGVVWCQAPFGYGISLIVGMETLISSVDSYFAFILCFLTSWIIFRQSDAQRWIPHNAGSISGEVWS